MIDFIGRIKQVKLSGLLKGAAILTIFSLIGKIIGVFFRLFLTGRIGSEGMGLYQLIMSVYSLFATFATAGFTVSVSRLVAEKLERDSGNARAVFKISLMVSSVISIASALIMLLCADFMAVKLLNDASVAAPLRILALSMPFMGLCSCFKGYFFARREVMKTASQSLFEQLVKIAVIALFLNVFMANTNDMGTLSVGIVIGVTLGEIFSFFYLMLIYIFSKRKLEKAAQAERDGVILRQFLGVALPISASSYVTNILHTIENILIPKMFEKFSGDRSDALSKFGMIRGMVIPVLFFPFAFLNSLVSMLIPEISRLNTMPDKSERNAKISKTISLSFIFSIAIGGLFYFFSYEVGETFYRGENTSEAIRILALVTPFMYIETISDGILKGIGEQMNVLRTSIYNSAMRILIIIFLIPGTGSDGYLWLLVVSNTYAFARCIHRLKKKTNFSFNFFRCAFLPFIFTCISGFISSCIIRVMNIKAVWLSAAAGSVIYLGLFFAMYLMSSLKRNKKILGKYV